MERNDDITPEEIRATLLRFAAEIQHLDNEGHLLESTPDILRTLGDLRARLFAYEVRVTQRLLPRDRSGEVARHTQSSAPLEPESRRIVEEAIRRMAEAEQEWIRGFGSDEESA